MASTNRPALFGDSHKSSSNSRIFNALLLPLLVPLKAKNGIDRSIKFQCYHCFVCAIAVVIVVAVISIEAMQITWRMCNNSMGPVMCVSLQPITRAHSIICWYFVLPLARNSNATIITTTFQIVLISVCRWMIACWLVNIGNYCRWNSQKNVNNHAHQHMRGVRNGQTYTRTTHTQKKERGTNTIAHISTYDAAMVHIHRHHHHPIPNSVLFSAI